ncbi:MAG: hypothetical protein ABW250_13885 [Pyrinomonadaceae bacterium]
MKTALSVVLAWAAAGAPGWTLRNQSMRNSRYCRESRPNDHEKNFIHFSVLIRRYATHIRNEKRAATTVDSMKTDDRCALMISAKVSRLVTARHVNDANVFKAYPPLLPGLAAAYEAKL